MPTSTASCLGGFLSQRVQVPNDASTGTSAQHNSWTAGNWKIDAMGSSHKWGYLCWGSFFMDLFCILGGLYYRGFPNFGKLPYQPTDPNGPRTRDIPKVISRTLTLLRVYSLVMADWAHSNGYLGLGNSSYSTRFAYAYCIRY